MTPEDRAIASISGIGKLLLGGKDLRSNVASILQDATIERSIDGASTLALVLYDDSRELLGSGIFDSRIAMQVDPFSFELVQVRKSGPTLNVTLEDLPVAALRRNDKPLKVAPHTTTHYQFAKRLVEEEKWLNIWTPAAERNKEKTKVAIGRGKPKSKGEKAEKEDSWTALGRIADERGWRRYVKNKNTIAYVPETYLLKQDPSYRLTEGDDGVDNIDFDFDIGKPVATVKVQARASRWAVNVGSCVHLHHMGPVNGNWIVSAISRSLFSLYVDITLTKARPELPEPKPPPKPKSSTQPGEGSTSGSTGKHAGGGVSSEGYIWPARGPITSGYGPRGSGFHTGTDIGVGTGTPVHASKSGTVAEAGWFGSDSYGNAVYLNHRDGSQTRYAHLHSFKCRRGEWVEQGDVIALSDSTGNSTGPHLHFEILVGGSTRNPLDYLP